MATLLELRERLNDDIGVLTDGETAPWPVDQRSRAIADGYAELYRVGILKFASQDLTSVATTWVYALTSIRVLERIEFINASGVISMGRGRVEPASSTTWQLRLDTPVDSGFTIRVRGWTAYVSTFADDTAVDDLPAEFVRIPLLKAKAICLRSQLARRSRYSSTSDAAPEMNVTTEQLIGLVASAEREWSDEVERLSGLRPRVGQYRTR